MLRKASIVAQRFRMNVFTRENFAADNADGAGAGFELNGF